jgi:lipoprotein NlpD
MKTLNRCSAIIGLLWILLTGCAANPHQAPIINGWRLPSGQHSHYVVQRGDTLYSVAWAFDMDFRDLSRINHLSPPYIIKAGQVLRMSSTASSPAAKAPVIFLAAKTAALPTGSSQAIGPKKSSQQTTHVVSSKSQPKEFKYNSLVTRWRWPAQGKVVWGFQPIPGGNKGINIAGKLGEPVVAAASCKIVYCGSILPGYGNLIIIKHNDQYLSAYANNKILLVKEGQLVTAGQVIAQMGMGSNGSAELHFEVRLNGKPIDPLFLLKRTA